MNKPLITTSFDDEFGYQVSETIKMRGGTYTNTTYFESVEEAILFAFLKYGVFVESEDFITLIGLFE